jgi:hypothetical protein
MAEGNKKRLLYVMARPNIRHSKSSSPNRGYDTKRPHDYEKTERETEKGG